MYRMIWNIQINSLYLLKQKDGNMKDFKNKSLILRKADVTKNFTIIPNYIPQSKSLSADSIYLLVLVLSKPADWYYVKTQFWRETQLGRLRFNNAWKELEKAGYIKSEKIMEGNLIRGYNYIISDSPIFGYTENSTNREVVDKQSTELQITEEQRKEIKTALSAYTEELSNKIISEIDFDKLVKDIKNA